MTLLPIFCLEGVNPFFIWLLISWTIAISSGLIWHIAANLYTAVDITLIHTKKLFKKDLLVRCWNTSQGGMYVPIIEKKPPKTYFSSITERDISIPFGRTLTMINPGTGPDLSIVNTIAQELNTAIMEMESNKEEGEYFSNYHAKQI